MFIKKILNWIVEKPERIFLTLAIPFCAFSAFMVPQMSEFDGDSHFNAIYRYSTLDFECNGKHDIPQNIADKINSGADGAREYYYGFGEIIDRENTVEFRCAGYEPMMYLPQIIGVMLANLIYPSVGLMVLLGRLFAAIAFCVVGYFLIKKIKIGKYVLLAVLLIPVMVQQGSTLSADAMSNLVAVAIIVFITNLFVQNEKMSRKQILLLLGLIVLTIFTKLNNVILFAPLAFLPSRLFLKNKLEKIPMNLHKWGVAALSGATFIGSYVLSQVINGGNSETLARSADNSVGVIHFINTLYNTYIADMGNVILDETFNQFSSFGYHAPMFMLIINILIILFALLYKNKAEKSVAKNASKSLAVSYIATGAVFVMAVSYIMLTAWAKPGTIFADGVQGRYFTAIIPLLIPLFILLQNHIRIDIKEKTFKRLMFATLLLILLSYAYYTLLYIAHSFDFNSGFVQF